MQKKNVKSTSVKKKQLRENVTPIQKTIFRGWSAAIGVSYGDKNVQTDRDKYICKLRRGCTHTNSHNTVVACGKFQKVAKFRWNFGDFFNQTLKKLKKTRCGYRVVRSVYIRSLGARFDTCTEQHPKEFFSNSGRPLP